MVAVSARAGAAAAAACLLLLAVVAPAAAANPQLYGLWGSTRGVCGAKLAVASMGTGPQVR